MAKAKRKTLPKNFEALLEAGDLTQLIAVFDTCDVNARGGYAKQTALAFDRCPDELARWLVANGADLSAADTWKKTPLHARARSWRGRLEVLLELGADIHAMVDLGTPLHSAADGKRTPQLTVLVGAGADVNRTNKRGLTPLELALQQCTNAELVQMVECARVLLDAGATRTPAMAGYVTEIGKRYEFHRSNIAPDLASATSRALAELYVMFEVAPVPRRTLHDGSSPIVVMTTTWQKQHAELWNLLVPSSHAAATVQGEVIRISGRISREIDGNGAINWDPPFRQMAKMFLDLVQRGVPLQAGALGEVEAIVGSLVKRASGNCARLAELAVVWVLQNPGPIKLGAVPYDR